MPLSVLPTREPTNTRSQRRVAPNARPLAALTMREREVLGLMAKGFSNAGISERIFVSAKTVEVHVGSIFGKLGILPEHGGNRRVLAVLAWLESSK
jgi:DNA-binding NarL/FixJ family response regulator